MPPVTCAEVRSALAGASAGRPLSGGDDVYTTLLDRRAIEGPRDHPKITPIGRHVLAELEVRAARTDGMALDAFADQLARVVSDLDTVAKTAEYFLAELGPVTPPEALPFLRPVAVGLANRRETPEELAEEFRNIWGSVEGMGGDPRDRLLAAELLLAASASMESMYSPLMTTINDIRGRLGEAEDAVAPSALLYLHPGADGKPAVEPFLRLVESGLPPEEAALLAGLGFEEAVSRRRTFSGSVGGPEGTAAVSFLAAVGGDASRHRSRIQALTAPLSASLPDPSVGAALLSAIDWLEPAEVADWVSKATDLARARQLAPSGPELTALGIALVHGLPITEFASSPPPRTERAASAGLLAIHRWVYRPLVAPLGGTPVGEEAAS